MPTPGGDAEPDAARMVALNAVERLITEVWGTGVKSEVVLRLLGLGHCRDTLVGDGGLMLRGISGGGKHAVGCCVCSVQRQPPAVLLS